MFSNLLNVSDNLADVNCTRFTNWSDAQEKPAILLYSGDIFKQFSAKNFTVQQQNYASDHIYILSGLYGLLRAYDKIKPYRLEMKTKIDSLNKISSYEFPEKLTNFWKKTLTNRIQKILKIIPLKQRYFINLASTEYSQSLDRKSIGVAWTDVKFLQRQSGEIKNYGIYAKQARGQFIRFMIEHDVTEFSQLLKYNYNGY